MVPYILIILIMKTFGFNINYTNETYIIFHISSYSELFQFRNGK